MSTYQNKLNLDSHGSGNAAPKAITTPTVIPRHKSPVTTRSLLLRVHSDGVSYV